MKILNYLCKSVFY